MFTPRRKLFISRANRTQPARLSKSERSKVKMPIPPRARGNRCVRKFGRAPITGRRKNRALRSTRRQGSALHVQSFHSVEDLLQFACRCVSLGRSGAAGEKTPHLP